MKKYYTLDLNERDVNMEIKEKLKKHKRKIIIGASLVGASLVGIILIAKNKKVNINTEDIKNTITNISEDVKEVKKTQDNKDVKVLQKAVQKEVEVNGHKRKLPKGWIASEVAKELARHNNIQLDENETYVRNYKKIA